MLVYVSVIPLNTLTFLLHGKFWDVGDCACSPNQTLLLLPTLTPSTPHSPGSRQIRSTVCGSCQLGVVVVVIGRRTFPFVLFFLHCFSSSLVYVLCVCVLSFAGRKPLVYAVKQFQ